MNRKLVVAALVLGSLTLLSIGLPVAEWVQSFSMYLRETGTAGRVAFLGVYVVVTVFPLPLFPFTVLAGFVYGMQVGYMLTLPVALLGSGVGVVLGASVLKKSVMDYVAKKPAWSAVVGALCGASTRAVILARLAPTMPFSVQNYVLGAVGVSLRPMLVGTLIAVQPILATGLYIGVVITDLAEMNNMSSSDDLSRLRVMMMCLGGVALITLVGWLSSVAKRSIREFGENGVETIPD